MLKWHLPWCFLPVLFSSAEQETFDNYYCIVKNAQIMQSVIYTKKKATT